MNKRSSLALFLAGSLLLPVACTKNAPDKASSAAPEAAASEAGANRYAAPGLTPIPAPPDVAAPPADAEKTPDGLASKVLTPGTGTVHPEATDKVKVNYTGWMTDGTMFDSSVARGQPITFPLTAVIKGWTEGLQLMVVGEKRRLWIPAALAYGEQPHGNKPPGELVFDVELLDIIPTPKPPPVPDDVKAPPANAKKTASGLAYRVLKPGTGTERPTATSTVTVNYTGWTTDGKMFDSSIPRGQPARFNLGGVIKGWTEGVQLMTKGESVRFWIPGNMAYGETPSRPGAPSGTLVFDIDLIDFHNPPSMDAGPKPPASTGTAPQH